MGAGAGYRGKNSGTCSLETANKGDISFMEEGFEGHLFLWLKIGSAALTGVAQLVGHHSSKQRVAGSIPRQGTCRGCEV